MGMDCTCVVEYRVENRWEMVGVQIAGRDYDAFDIIRGKAAPGYPTDADRQTVCLLNNTEEFGECWMTMTEFRKVLMKHPIIHDIYRKKHEKDMRVVFRFDC